MSNMMKFMRTLLMTALVGGGLLCQSGAATGSQGNLFQLRNTNTAGTYMGESICMGNRPACKNEMVVYFFEAVSSKPGVFMLFADKIIKGKRVPMFKQEFQYDASGRLTPARTTQPLYGFWQYHVAATGETIEGTLSLTDQTTARRVKIKRVDPKRLPAAPGKEMYPAI
jgi:hypothetical protein